MDTTAVRVDMTLKPEDNHRLASLYGQLDENLRQIEARLNVKISCRGPNISIYGGEEQTKKAKLLLKRLYQESLDHEITPDRVHLCLQEMSFMSDAVPEPEHLGALTTNRGVIKPRGPNQSLYLRNIDTYDINFGIGPAGTGKSYLAVATAIHALEHDKVRRIILVRPAVEAGESLGFLPGDLEQKIDPYLRPLYDALYELMGFERVHQLLERGVIEVAPLAYMRGRTLNDSFIILDESQNTTIEQMKMFLTRIGFNSTAVVTGDITQIDLPRGKRSGLKHVMEVLKDTKDISFTFFNAGDVVRHPLVQKIVEAYHKYEQEHDEHRGH